MTTTLGRIRMAPESMALVRSAAKRFNVSLSAYVRMRLHEAATHDLEGVVVTGATTTPIATPSTTPTPERATTTSELTPEQLAECDRRAATMLARMKAAKPA